MADNEIEVNGGIVVYEFIGPEDGEVVVVTPGGRFSKDFGGVHELAYALADGGKRVLLWDRPNGGWSDLIAANPRNRDRLLAIGSNEFERVMNRWLDAFIPKPNEAIPGVSDWEFDQIKVPTLIIRGGEKDYDHPPRTSMEVHSLI